MDSGTETDRLLLVCQGTIVSLDINANSGVIGFQFFDFFYTIFDMEQGTMSFAPYRGPSDIA